MEDIKEEGIEYFGGGLEIWPAEILQENYKEWKEELEKHMTEDDSEEELEFYDRDFSGFPYWVTSSPDPTEPIGFESKEEALQFVGEHLGIELSSQVSKPKRRIK
jgi:hypothetical protein